MKKITVVVITYKQQDVISRALDSILCQKEYGLYKIVVSDDCSPDNNWDVISSYKEKYPEIIDAHRNKKNMGIYGNMEHAFTFVKDTDLVIMCSGDDALCDGYFKTIQEFIEENKIDTSKAVSIFSDFKTINPNGKENIGFNSHIMDGQSVFTLKLREVIFNRSVFSSLSVFKQFKPLPLEKGLSISEGVFDLMLEQNTEKAYYMPYVGSIYYAGIGVSTKLTTSGYILEESNKWLYYTQYFNLTKSDKYFCYYKAYLLKFLVYPNLKILFNTIKYYIKSQIHFNKNSCKDFILLLLRLVKRFVIQKRAI